MKQHFSVAEKIKARRPSVYWLAVPHHSGALMHRELQSGERRRLKINPDFLLESQRT